MIGAVVKFIILFIIIFFIMRVFFKLIYPTPPKHLKNARNHPLNPTSITRGVGDVYNATPDSTDGSATEMLTLERCAVCGKTVSESIAIKKGEYSFCSAEHLTEFLDGQQPKQT